MGSETASQRSFDRTREASKARTRELSPWSARRAMTLANSASNRPQRTRSRSRSKERSREKEVPSVSRSSRESTGKTRSRETASDDAREKSKSASLGSGREASGTSGKRRAPSDSPEPYQRSRERSRDRRRDRSRERRRDRSTDKGRDRSRENRRDGSKEERGSRSRDERRDRSRERRREPRNGHRDRSRDRNRPPARRRNRSSPRSPSRSRSRSTTRSTTRKRKLPISRSPSPAPYHTSHKRRDRSPSPPRHHRRHSRSPTPSKHHKRHKRYSPSPSRSRSPTRHRSRKPLPSQAQQLAIRGLDSSSGSLGPTQTGGAPVAKEKPNFKPTGLLAKEANLVAGTKISLKYHEPPEARKPPPSAPWMLFIFKGEGPADSLELGKQSCWLFGRTREVADVWLEHPSCSGQHAAIQFRYIERMVGEDEFGARKKVGKVRPYLIDLESSNGTMLNGESVEGGRYVELRDKDVVTFGGSEREYMIMLPPKE